MKPLQLFFAFILVLPFRNTSRAQCSSNAFDGEPTTYQVTENSITIYWSVNFTPSPPPYEGYAVWYRLNDISLGVSGWVNATPLHPAYGTNYFYDNRNFFTITGLRASATYDIEIVHLCNGATSSHRPQFPITTAATPTATIKGPVNVRASGITNTTANIYFDYYPINLSKVSLDRFEVYIREDGISTWTWVDFTYEYLVRFGIPTSVGGLKPGTKYFMRVDEHYTLNPGETYESHSAVSSSSANFFITTGYGEANPGPPIAVAATTPAVLAFGTTQTTLSGLGSRQPFGTNKTIAYQWRQLPTYLTYIPTPTSHTPSFAWPLQETSQNTTVIDLKSGNYVYELAVRNYAGKITKDTVRFEVLAECGSHKGSFVIPNRSVQPGLDFYSGTISSSFIMSLANKTHTFKGGAVILHPGFVTSVSGTGGFLAAAFDKTKCPGYVAPARMGAAVDGEYTWPYTEIKDNPETPAWYTASGEIMLLPNPAGNTVRIALKNPDEKIRAITISDASGKPVLQRNTTYDLLDISRLSSGIYFVRVQTENGFLTEKLVKQ